MSLTIDVDKDRTVPAALPRMLGDTDVGLILEFAARLPEGAKILEIGPWLGGLTRELARFGVVTVVDRFIWSDGNDASLPGLAVPGESFRHLFEQSMAEAGFSAQIIEADIADFSWDSGRIDFVVIDAPRTPDRLHGCLATISAALEQDAVILVKHGLNRSDIAMGAYLDALIGLGVLEIVATEQPDWCNIAVLRPGNAIADFPGDLDAFEIIRTARLPQGISDPWYGRLLSVGRLGYLAQQGDWADVWRRLAELPPSGGNLSTWDGLEPEFHDTEELLDPNWAILSELLWVQNDTSLAAKPPVAVGSAVPGRLRAYWCNNRDHPWRCDLLDPGLLAEAAFDGEIEQVAPHIDTMFDADVVQISGDPKGGALAALLCGCRSFAFVPSDEAAGLPDSLERFPHFAVARVQSEIASCLKTAGVVFLGGTVDEGSEMGRLLTARIQDHKGNPLVIDLHGLT